MENKPDSLRQALKTRREALKAAYHAHPNPEQLLSAHSALMDEFVIRIWKEAGCPVEAALAAVGGYGRGHLFPASDVDLLILLAHSPTPEEEQTLSSFISTLWDMGLEIGHSVRTKPECLEEAARDITVQTALIELRYLTGAAELLNQLSIELASKLDKKAFFEAKMLEQKQRYNKNFGVSNSLEPNLKEGIGGLRDLHTLIWVARAAGLGSSWDELAEAGLLTASETRLLKRSERTLQSIRIALHYTVNRHEDRLLFDLQETLAKVFHISDKPPHLRPSERLMKTVYRATRTISQLNTLVTQSLRDRLEGEEKPVPIVLTPDFVRVGQELALADLDGFQKKPSTILESFLLLQQYADLRGMTTETLRALWNARIRINSEFRTDPKNHALFLEIFKAPRGITRVLRMMNRYGILGRYIPAFGRITGQMQHDLFHVYTVDEHILMVVRNLRRFALGAFSHEYPFCSRLMEEFEKPELLYLAGLFHDIAKGRGGDHSALGQVDALQFCLEHGLSQEDAELIAWLVAQHLNMSQVAQKQDIYDPDTIERFAELVKTPRHLTALYLLTVADIRGTSPKVWNAWKAKLLEDLYNATLRRLTASEGFTVHSLLEDRQKEAKYLLQLYTLSPSAHEAFWKQLETVYFLRHEAREIAWHTRLLFNRVNTPEPIIKARLSESGEGLQVLLYSADRSDVFVRACHFFERNHYSINDAKMYLTRHGYVLYTLHVFMPDQQSAHYRDLINYIEYELKTLLQADTPLPAPVSGRVSRQVRHFPLSPEVLIRPDDTQKYYLLSVIASDRPGLLSRIARILLEHGVHLHAAKISTLGERAEDTFLITAPGLVDNRIQMQIQTQLLNGLQS